MPRRAAAQRTLGHALEQRAGVTRCASGEIAVFPAFLIRGQRRFVVNSWH
jgi:hypothetical protein